jgi:hypothetical protein
VEKYGKVQEMATYHMIFTKKKWKKKHPQRNFSLEEMGRVKSEASNYKYWASVGGKHSILEVREFNPDPTAGSCVSRGKHSTVKIGSSGDFTDEN